MRQKSEIISRIAPTPSGFLHLGNAFNFAYTYIVTQSVNGNLHLRIDDIDGTRSRPEYIADIFRVLEWLGIEWDHGPNSPDDFTKNFSQLHKVDHYRSVLKKIEEATYPCRCSRKSIKEQYLDGIYRGACKNAVIDYVDDKTSIRLTIPENEDSFRAMGHPIIWRKDGFPSYQLVSVIEDEEMRINRIIRGEDLIDSTNVQLYISKLLKYKKFPMAKIEHHPLLLDPSGKKLSKSDGSLSVKEMIKSGLSLNNFLQDLSDYFMIPCGSTLQEMAQLYEEK